MNRIKTYIQEAYLELMQKVAWPSWAELQSSGIVVLVAVAMITLIIFAMDFGSKQILQDLVYPALSGKFQPSNAG